MNQGNGFQTVFTSEDKNCVTEPVMRGNSTARGGWLTSESCLPGLVSALQCLPRFCLHFRDSPVFPIILSVCLYLCVCICDYPCVYACTGGQGLMSSVFLDCHLILWEMGSHKTWSLLIWLDFLAVRFRNLPLCFPGSGTTGWHCYTQYLHGCALSTGPFLQSLYRVLFWYILHSPPEFMSERFSSVPQVPLSFRYLFLLPS